MTTNELATTPKNELIAPEFIDAADFGTGFEGTDKDSFAIPFLTILQKMSPMVDEDDAKHVEGAKPGMIFNTVTQRMIDGKTGLIIIPCFFKRSYILWGGREGDGGFKGEIAPEDFDKILASGKVEVVDGRPLVKDDKGETHPKKSDYYADTRAHYVLTIDPETGEIGQAIMSLSSTQIRASKMLMTALYQKTVQTPQGPKRPPTYANQVRMTTISQSNDKGSWSGAKFDLEGFVTDPAIYNAAKEFAKSVAAGDVKVDHSKAPSQSAEVGEGSKTADEF